MTDELAESARRLFTVHATKDALQAAEAGIWPEPLWQAVEDAGFTAALLPERAGGFGATAAEAMSLVRVAAAHAAPIPLGETVLAAWLLARAGLEVPSGPLTLAATRRADRLSLAGGRIAGTAYRVPWARPAVGIVVVAGERIALVAPAGYHAEAGANLAGEPRDTVTFDAAVTARPCADDLRAAGAALRAVQLAGALERVLAVCLAYVQARAQFGRPIGRFQVIQHALAQMAGQVAAAGAAADMVADAFDTGLTPMIAGAAKARAGEAASIAAGLAHQVHGAIGFTQEYELQWLTRRLWSWRDEFGTEAEWNEGVGRAVLHAGPAGLWPAIAAA